MELSLKIALRGHKSTVFENIADEILSPLGTNLYSPAFYGSQRGNACTLIRAEKTSPENFWRGCENFGFTGLDPVFPKAYRRRFRRSGHRRKGARKWGAEDQIC